EERQAPLCRDAADRFHPVQGRAGDAEAQRLFPVQPRRRAGRLSEADRARPQRLHRELSQAGSALRAERQDPSPVRQVFQLSALQKSPSPHNRRPPSPPLRGERERVRGGASEERPSCFAIAAARACESFQPGRLPPLTPALSPRRGGGGALGMGGGGPKPSSRKPKRRPSGVSRCSPSRPRCWCWRRCCCC